LTLLYRATRPRINERRAEIFPRRVYLSAEPLLCHATGEVIPRPSNIFGSLQGEK
jgi:hypothetical protein